MSLNFETRDQKRHRVHAMRESALLSCITTACLLGFLPTWVFGIYLGILIGLYVMSLIHD